MFERARLDDKNAEWGPTSRLASAVLFFAVFAAVVFFHLDGMGGDFLSDDFVHAQWIANAHMDGRLGHWLLERFYLPLDSTNYAYRPVVFASYALDWMVYGPNAAGWHLSNLLVHLLNGALVMVLTLRLARSAAIPDPRFAALAGAALFLAIPFAGESTFWPVGRFDLLALSFSLAFLVFLLDGLKRPRPWRTFAALLCLLLALLSKESAMPMLAVGFVLVYAFSLDSLRPAGRSVPAPLFAAFKLSLVRYWPVITLVLAYFAWRYFLFGSPLKVYPSSHLPGSFSELFSRVRVAGNVFTYPYGDQALLWGALVFLAAAAWLAGLVTMARSASFLALSLIALLACCFLGYLLAPATSFPLASGNGEGIRNLYIPWALFSLFAGLGISQHRLRLVLLGIMLMVALWGQWRLLSLWQDTAAEMHKVTSAIPALAATLDDGQYALLLLPDHIAAVPFVRTAQGGVVTPPRQAVSYLSRLAAMTPLQFAEWESHLSTNVIGGLKGGEIPFDRSNFSHVYCWRPSTAHFVRLESRPHPGNAGLWEQETMTEAARSGCLL